MEIKLLGTGCKDCERMEKNLKQAIAELDLTATIEKVGDLKEIVAYGVMEVPTLVINDQVVKSGRKLSVKQLKKILI